MGTRCVERNFSSRWHAAIGRLIATDCVHELCTQLGTLREMAENVGRIALSLRLRATQFERVQRRFEARDTSNAQISSPSSTITLGTKCI